jgi:uncharacterized membrane protein HdeD (DUF308 family)
MATATAYVPHPEVPWWVGVIVGLATVVVGFLLLTDPGMTTVVLVQLLGLYWLAAGFVQLASIFVNAKGWGWKLAGGILGIIAGLVTIQHPLWSPVVLGTTLVFMIGMFGMLFGVMSVVNAFTGAGWGTGILGGLSVIFGLMLMFDPLGSAVALPFIFGVLGIAGGIAATIMAFRARELQKHGGIQAG